MPTAPLLDDATIDALVDGGDVPPELSGLAWFAARVRGAGAGAAPRPTPALATLLTDGTPAARAVARVTSLTRGPRRSAL
ncbi:MAG TPA: hypothetical protein VJM49_04155, partial [Acidimicrobiales bacterium]|nr:hypothetical protein [Acidimicrobiales bacterium]